ncbi:MAG TPA: enoyl-CoA hydratase-related protein [Actinomycetota bacterium]|nr:enoyl-CoA hydratase-related protein [Actinomycetota bacterium]
MVVEVTSAAARANIVLRRPEVLNAMDWEVFDGLARAADEIAAAADVRVAVVSGEGRSFSSGIDTSTFGDLTGSAAERIQRAQAGFRKIAALPMPTVAQVRGHALGAGLQLALACDIRVVAEDASLGLLEAKYGIIPDLGGTQQLPRLVGRGRAKKMIWLAERITGHEAGAIGLAELVVAPGELDRAVDELAERIAKAPPLAVRRAKELVDLADSVAVAEGMDAEAGAQLSLLASSDFGEAIGAFIEGRDPSFTGS